MFKCFFNEKINKLGSIDGPNLFLYKTMSKHIFQVRQFDC